MSEPRFTIQKSSEMYLHLPIFDNGVEMADGDVCILLNEQQATIQELERKLKKYAKIGEEQLEQIIDLQDELQEYRARPTLDTDNCGHCKHFQIDGMFGMWCEKGRDWTLVNKNCSDFER